MARGSGDAGMTFGELKVGDYFSVDSGSSFTGLTICQKVTGKPVTVTSGYGKYHSITLNVKVDLIHGRGIMPNGAVVFKATIPVVTLIEGQLRHHVKSTL